MKLKTDLDYNINSIFPTPIYTAKLKKFTDMELKVVRLMENQTVRNMGNSRTSDTYVLKLKHFENIKKQLDVHIRNYFDKVISTSDKVIPYITQSWLNYTRENEYMHSHAHPNSFISGVLYFDAIEDKDKIHFSQIKYNSIKLTIDKYNLHNSETWYFPVATGNLFIFPSDTQHKGEQKEGNNVRTSLSFNVFVKGALGNDVDNNILFFN
jgi:uncharacterized protein (TIGR02466 family)